MAYWTIAHLLSYFKNYIPPFKDVILASVKPFTATFNYLNKSLENATIIFDAVLFQFYHHVANYIIYIL